MSSSEEKHAFKSAVQQKKTVFSETKIERAAIEARLRSIEKAESAARRNEESALLHLLTPFFKPRGFCIRRAGTKQSPYFMLRSSIAVADVKDKLKYVFQAVNLPFEEEERSRNYFSMSLRTQLLSEVTGRLTYRGLGVKFGEDCSDVFGEEGTLSLCLYINRVDLLPHALAVFGIKDLRTEDPVISRASIESYLREAERVGQCTQP